MTTGRINQVTMVQNDIRERGDRDPFSPKSRPHNVPKHKALLMQPMLLQRFKLLTVSKPLERFKAQGSHS